MPMLCKCALVRFDSEQLKRNLGRSWDLGPIVVSKELGSSSLSIFVKKETVDAAIYSFSEFKGALLSEGDLPFRVQFALQEDRGLYGFGDVEFDETIVCRYLETRFTTSTIEIVLDMVAKGKELGIFNGVSSKTEQSGEQKPLFWSSILKGNIH